MNAGGFGILAISDGCNVQSLKVLEMDTIGAPRQVERQVAVAWRLIGTGLTSGCAEHADTHLKGKLNEYEKD
jgi:hypothetical protein